MYVDTIQLREEHHARFGCKIKLNRESKEINIMPFTVILGGDSRKSRYQINDESTYDYEQKIKDSGRKILGFTSLGSYDSFLEEDLSDSKMTEEIIKRFEKINSFSSTYEDFSATYDSFLTELGEDDKAEKIIRQIANDFESIFDFSTIVDKDEVDIDTIQEVRSWAESKFDRASEIIDRQTLPDTLNFGETISIVGVDDNKISLSISEIMINPSEGEEEYIDISLFKDRKKIASGFVKLTVGYLNFDEDGGAADGIEDSIEYTYDEILEEIDDFISEQQEQVENEAKIVELIESIVLQD